ncbi:MAG TPA: threonine/serine dehydratase [Burkholderiales bacterium]|nr:threonine/serine dehydratase [Burkholderiales bacterium]
MFINKWTIEDAAKRVASHLAPTPLVRARHFTNRVGANVYFKLETLQPTHSFKVRGAFNSLAQLPPELHARGVITASGGNHGLALAYAARVLHIPATVYLPENSHAIRVAAIRAFGAGVVLHGAAWDDANAKALEEAARTELAYIHPFDNIDVMAGQATIVTELLNQIGRVDLIVASIGGGGLISGIASAVRHFSPKTRVVGVETEGADSMHQSLKAGMIVELPAITSVAETLGAKKTEQTQFAIVSEGVSEVVVVPDALAIAALIETLQEEKLLTEPATSCSIAALTDGRIPVKSGENVVVVLCGANVSLDRVWEWSHG